MSIKIKDAPDTNVKGTLKIPVGNVGDNEPHTITINNLKSWIQGGGIPWTSVTDKPVFVATTDLATVNGQILYGRRPPHRFSEGVEFRVGHCDG